jgi:hypothetical protein
MIKKRVKKTNNDLKNITPKTKDRATQTPLKPVVNSGAPEGCAVPVPNNDVNTYLYFNSSCRERSRPL